MQAPGFGHQVRMLTLCMSKTSGLSWSNLPATWSICACVKLEDPAQFTRCDERACFHPVGYAPGVLEADPWFESRITLAAAY